MQKKFLKISQNSQENTYNNLQASGLQLCLKRDSGTDVSLLVLQNF